MDPAREARRLAALRDLAVLDTGPEDRFDRIVEVARRLFDVPMVGLNLIDEDRQFSKAAVGLDRHAPRQDTFCTHTIEGDDVLLVQDATRDPRFEANPFVVGDPGIRFYAGQPLTARGEHVGALCIIDDKPRDLSTADRELLALLGRWAESELELDRELVQAREVQRRLLPHRPPDLPGFTIAGRCLPAREVGGDFYDWQVHGDRLQLVVADVMGKGVTAAVIAAGVRAVLRGTSRFNDLATAVSRTGASMQEDLDASGTFVTLLAVRFTDDDGTFEYVDAGHGLGLVLRPDGSVRPLASDGLPLGAVVDDRWAAHADTLAPGETLLLCTDGLLDHLPVTTGPAHDAVADALPDPQTPPPDLVDLLLGLVDRGHQPDDVTVVAVRRGAP